MGLRVLVTAIFNTFQNFPDQAAFLSFVLMAVTFSTLVLARRLAGRASVGGAAVRVAHPLGGWRWPAFGAVCVLLAIGLFVPVAALGIWLLSGLRAGAEALALVPESVGHSGKAATLAAVATTAAALPIAFLSVRRPGFASSWMERSVYIANALPGVVIALVLVLVATRVILPLYQTLPLLVAAYVVLFLPLAHGSVKSNWEKISRRLEEAGWMLGRRPSEVFLRVTLPLLAPGIVSGAALVFIATLKELPATLMLSPAGFHTLAFRTFDALDDGHLDRAAVPALVLLVVALGGVLLLLGAESRRTLRSA